MFKIHKPHLSGSIHSGHFMVSRLDDDDDDNNDPADDSSESERDNANSVEIDPNNPESVVDASNMDLSYQVESPSNKNEQLTSWNDLDRPAKQSQKQNQYLTYYTNSYNCDDSAVSGQVASSSPQSGHSKLAVSAASESSMPLADRHHAAPRGLDVGGQQSRFRASTMSPFAQDSSRDAYQCSLDQHCHHSHDQHLVMQRHLQPRHAVTIDTSLTKLFETMSLYYSSNLTSPKWKSFKGLKLRLKNKIRLNNLIWRTWFLQYIRGRRPPGCRFTAPVETDVHKKSETVVLEGKYWKRKEKAIVDEYKKWRIFHKHKQCQMHCFRPSSFDWDSRVSNLASSSMCGPEYQFYPDYDMNIAYNLDDLPPMLEEMESRVPEQYYQPPLASRPAPRQQAQAVKMIEPPTTQQQQANQLQPQLHQEHNNHQQQLTQLQIPSSSSSSSSHLQALALKRDQQHQHQQQQQHQQQHQQQQQQQQQMMVTASSQQLSHHQHLQSSFSQAQATYLPQQLATQSSPPQQQQQQQPLSFALDNSQLYQQMNQQQQHGVIMSNELYSLDGSGALVGDGSAASMQLGGGGGESGRTEQRRVCHINAEQKRRCNIKNGFDTLKSMLPSINQNVNVKTSKASMLQKAALYISSLSAEQKQQAEEQSALKQQIDNLKQTIRAYQCQLPASGAPAGCSGSNQAREMLQSYVRKRTLENWKFWIFSLLIETLFETYYNTVSTTSLEDSCRTIFTWLDSSCGLVSLRKEASESLTFLSTSTNILNTPQTLPTEAVDAVRYHTGSASIQPSQVNHHSGASQFGPFDASKS